MMSTVLIAKKNYSNTLILWIQISLFEYLKNHGYFNIFGVLIHCKNRQKMQGF